MKDAHRAQGSGVSVGMLEQLKKAVDVRKLGDRPADRQNYRSRWLAPNVRHSSFKTSKIKIAMDFGDTICEAVPTAAPIR